MTSSDPLVLLFCLICCCCFFLSNHSLHFPRLYVTGQRVFSFGNGNYDDDDKNDFDNLVVQDSVYTNFCYE